MLAPWWLLGTLIVVFGAFAFAAARAGRDSDTVRPLCALGLLALPYLPWLPDRLPVLRAAAGPARFLVWTVVAWLVGAPGIARSLGASMGRWRWCVPLARRSLVIFVASAVVFGAVAWRMVGTPLFPGGDEPHYLVITQSLLRDGDLKIENNHARGDYREYFGQTLKPDYLALGKDGAIYSVHPVGMPILAIPAFTLGGYHGVVVMMILMAALASTLMWRWAFEFTGSAPAATFAWAGAALTAPFLFNAFTVYPEIPAALAVMVALTWRPSATTVGVALIRGTAIGVLPWLSTKYAPMAAALVVVSVLRGGWKPRAILALVTPVVALFAGWFAFFYVIWGTISPSAPYGASEPMTLRYLAHGGLGLLFDQEYGLVAAAPVLIAGLVGIGHLVRTGGARARRGLELAATFGALLVTVGAFRLWWGGEASAGRPVASGLLLLGLPLAWLYARSADRPAARAGLHVLLALSLGMVGVMLLSPDGMLAHQDRDGTSVLVDWASPTWPLSSAFPSFIIGSLREAIARMLAWLMMGAVVAWLVWRLGPRRFGAGALAALMLAVAGSATVASVFWTTAALPAFAPESRDRVPLLDRFDRARRPTAVLFDPLSRISSADALSRVTLIARPGLRTDPQSLDPLWNARFALPAGEYRLRLTRPAAASAGGTMLALQVGRTGPALERWSIEGPVWERRFLLPVDADFVAILAPPELGAVDGELQLTPVMVVDEGSRIRRPPGSGVLRHGGLTAFFHGDGAFPEADGFWTRGSATAQVTYAADAGSPVRAVGVIVDCGPVANEVTLSTPTWEERVALTPGSTRAVMIPTVAQPALGLQVAPVEIAVRSGFVPALVDRTSTDRRSLGCWIAFAPQP